MQLDGARQRSPRQGSAAADPTVSMPSASTNSRPASRRFLLLAILCGGFLALVWIFHTGLTSSGQYADRDFMSLYAGGRAVLQGLDPYDPQVWTSLRARLGGTWHPDARAPFPLWSLLPLVPFSLLDLEWAAAAWLALSVFALALGVLLLLRPLGRGRSLTPLELVALIMLTFTFRATLLGLHNGQITFQIFLFLALFLMLEGDGRPFLAGSMLAGLLLKPNAFMLLVPALGLWLLYKRRWAILAGAFVGAAVPFSISWLLRPDWFGEWITVRSKTAVTQLTPTLWGLAYEVSPANWALLGLGLVAAATALLGWLIFSQRDLSVAQVTCLALVASLLTTPYTWAYEHLFLLIPAMAVFLAVDGRRYAILLWVTMTCLLPLGALWWAGYHGIDTYSAVVVLLTGLLYWYYAIRRPRMAAHPPRFVDSDRARPPRPPLKKHTAAGRRFDWIPPRIARSSSR